MLRPEPISPVPEETTRVARAAFRKGNFYMRMRDELGALYTDADFTTLFPGHGRPAETPWRLALVTVMQYVEGLSDQQTADAVRARIDWKYSCATRGRIMRVGSGRTPPQVSVPDLSPILACVAGNGGVRSRG